MTVGIICDQDIIWAKGFGYANLEKRIPKTVDTKYLLASNTKQFTAIAIFKLRDEGKLYLNDPVEKYVPWINSIQNAFTDAPKITIRHLLTHSSGLPRDASYPYWLDYKIPTINEIKAKLPEQKSDN